MIVSRAPLRIPLGGGGTDFPSYYRVHGGYILGFALNKYVHVVLHNTIDKRIRLKYSKVEDVSCTAELENRVAAECLKWFGITHGVEIATFADVPEASGLGGSSAFCVALVAALAKNAGMDLNSYEIFETAWEIERENARMPGGIQDQFFAAMGGAWRVEMVPKDLGVDSEHRKLDGVEYGMVRVDALVKDLLPYLKLVFVGGRKNGVSSSGLAEKQEERIEKWDEEMLQNLSRVKEHGRMIETALKAQEYGKVGELFHEHWENKKRRDSGISREDIDRRYEELRREGCPGGKVLGMGGGGYLLMFSENGMKPTLDVGMDLEGVKVVYEA